MGEYCRNGRGVTQMKYYVNRYSDKKKFYALNWALRPRLVFVFVKLLNDD